MKNIFSLFTQHKETKMTPEEKKQTWETISARTFLLAMDTPVRKSILSRLYYRGLPSNSNQQGRSFLRRKYTLSVIAGTLIVSGSISAFAQGSLPGDFFYPVKTDVNEKIQISFAFTPQAKANVEATLATNRLEETEGLALEGKLSPTLKQQTDENFNSHVQKFETQLTELGDRSEFSDIAKVGVSFQTRIAVHAAILKDMEVNNKILSSAGVTTKTTENNSNSRVVFHLEDKVLSAAIPTIIATRKAIEKISGTPVGLDVYKDGKGRNNASLAIDPKEAEDYLKQLHQDVGTPLPLTKTSLTPVVSAVAPQIIP